MSDSDVQKMETILDNSEKQMEDIMARFKKHGDKASYHYADDSTKEWGLAKKEKDFALEIFDAYPTLRKMMREVAEGFLWRLNQDRPHKEK